MEIIPIISIHSYRGGTGKTFLAANMAYQLTTLFQKRVLLMDFDILAGNLSSFLMNGRKEHQGYINDYIKATKDLKDIISSLTENLDFIAAMKEEDLLYLEKKAWIKTFRRMLIDMEDLVTTKKYDLVLIDNHPAILHPTLTSLALCTSALWLIRANKMSILNFLELTRNSAFLEMLRQKNTKLVINMMLSGKEKDFIPLLDELQKILPIIGIIPFWEDLFTGLRDVRYLALEKSTDALTKEINKVCQHVIQ